VSSEKSPSSHASPTATQRLQNAPSTPSGQSQE
jgi:hypothetical protein